MSETLMLRTTDLGVRFGSFDAVGGVNLCIEPGARHALIGPNGAGKTTLINLLTGVIRPTSGRVELGGQDITHLRADQRVRAGLSRTFQINTLFPRLTPLSSVVLAVCEREGLGACWWKPVGSMRKIHDEAMEILGSLRLADLANVPVVEMAYGKQRLLEIALALATQPRILLLDEPAAGVPAGESTELFEVIAKLPEDISILFIEHDMNLVFRFAQRISVLVAGKVFTEGSPGTIANDPGVKEVYLGRKGSIAALSGNGAASVGHGVAVHG
ncbi:ABC transporter ATP-binding protein [Cupriavidus pauculus]|uniref:ABC transporter ATP-binding protein n=1 Tax=Cupriavidus pauculus TaxID=82633 RepID=A0A5P2HGN8_9BURK|nr:ABC transporter ATP-binding protein [Cupriavidus pauculus]QET06395.1 ABC transporter ATP-binding protein [Cupriavidus pauculus]